MFQRGWNHQPDITEHNPWAVAESEWTFLTGSSSSSHQPAFGLGLPHTAPSAPSSRLDRPVTPPNATAPVTPPKAAPATPAFTWGRLPEGYDRNEWKDPRYGGRFKSRREYEEFAYGVVRPHKRKRPDDESMSRDCKRPGDESMSRDYTLVGQKVRLLSLRQWTCLSSSSAHPFSLES